MSILQRYFTVAILQAVAFVLVGFLALSAFNDLKVELGSIGKGAYALQHAFLYVLMLVPANVSQLMPFAALIGTIYAMAQFASSSEFTIMRASSMSTLQAVGMVFKVGIGLVVVMFVFSEVITPRTTPMAERMKLSAMGATVSQEFRSGLWTKDFVRSGGMTGQVTGSRFFNVHNITPDGQLQGVKLYEFDTAFRLRSLTTAARALYQGKNIWRLSDVIETTFSTTHVLPQPGQVAPEPEKLFGQGASVVATTKLATRDLVTEITPNILSVSGSDPTRMSVSELGVYIAHLRENRQETELFEITFWKKLIDPLAIFVLMALALPFAYMHTRSGGVSFKLFIGIMIGVSFSLVNNLFSHLGLLSTWPPLMTAVAPSLLYLLLALGALRWVERH